MPGGVEIKVSIDDRELKDLLGRLQSRLGNLTPVMKIIGEIVRKSVWENFRQGGRPDEWAPNSPATLKRKKGNSPLIGKGMSGGMMGSITYRAGKDRVEIGTNKKYAATHQFGRGRISSIKTRRELPAIPARPFLMVQDEDWPTIKEAINSYLLRQR